MGNKKTNKNSKEVERKKVKSSESDKVWQNGVNQGHGLIDGWTIIKK